MHSEVFLAHILITTIGMLWGVAALGKMRGFALFCQNLVDSFSIPSSMAAPLTVLIVLVELILATLLLVGPSTLILLSLYVSCLLFLMFTLVVVQKLLTYQRVTCNCFGIDKEKLTYADVLRNSFIIVGCLVASQYYQPVTMNDWDNGALLLISISLVLYLLNFKLLAKAALYKGAQ